MLQSLFERKANSTVSFLYLASDAKPPGLLPSKSVNLDDTPGEVSLRFVLRSIKHEAN